MKSVAVIGQGSWGKKIFNSVQNSFSDVQVEMLSSRIFLSSPPKRNFDVIWIAGRPINQARTLEIAQNKSKVVILEKPVGATLQDFSIIEDLLSKDNTKIDLSRPWCFSNTWISVMEKIKSWDLKGASISFDRSGPKSHDEIPPVEDWLPHDIYLASDLIPEFELGAKVNYFKASEDTLEACLDLSGGATLNFNFRETKVRKTQVSISAVSGMAFIDFLEKRVQVDGKLIQLKLPDNHDEISRNFLSSINVDNRKTGELLRTQKWMKYLINQRS
jgi:predicted dehydrogenase